MNHTYTPQLGNSTTDTSGLSHNSTIAKGCDFVYDTVKAINDVLMIIGIITNIFNTAVFWQIDFSDVPTLCYFYASVMEFCFCAIGSIGIIAVQLRHQVSHATTLWLSKIGPTVAPFPYLAGYLAFAYLSVDRW